MLMESIWKGDIKAATKEWESETAGPGDSG